jgi:NADH-quinone oxidoreductase subunit L
LAAIALAFWQWKTVNFSLLWDTNLQMLVPDTVFGSLFSYEITSSGLVVFFLILAAMAKSAQLGLHTWLPDAMEGPTPVSALIHAATMVTAGILLLIKVFPLLALHTTLSFFVAVVGAVTSVFAGSVACAQHDIKKIIAYSTCSQLGLMFMACGMGYPEFAFFHLVTHAFFKALLFLSAGSVVHYAGNEQDIRKMGGLATVMPLTNITFFFGNLCIMGFPFYSGFYSKEILVLGSAQFSFFLFVLCLTSTFLTTVYSCRLHWYVM